MIWKHYLLLMNHSIFFFVNWLSLQITTSLSPTISTFSFESILYDFFLNRFITVDTNIHCYTDTDQQLYITQVSHNWITNKIKHNIFFVFMKSHSLLNFYKIKCPLNLLTCPLSLLKCPFLCSFMNNESHLPCVRDQFIGPKQDSQNQ